MADDVTFVGSFNFSRSGERNAENVLEIHDATVADRLAAFIDDGAGPLPADDASSDRGLSRRRLAAETSFVKTVAATLVTVVGVVAAVAATAAWGRRSLQRKRVRCFRPTTRGIVASTRCP